MSERRVSALNPARRFTVTRRALLRLTAGAALASTLAGCANYATTGAFPAPANAPYRLSAGDKLRVLVFGQDNLSNIYAVDGGGRISMPLIGSVPVAGQTTAQVEGEVGRRLREGYVREPHISIQVEQYRPFFVLGEVNQPGQFPYVNGLTAQNAVAIAGGFSPRGERDGIEITRLIDGRLVTGFLPITAALQPGDTVTVRERWF